MARTKQVVRVPCTPKRPVIIGVETVTPKPKVLFQTNTFELFTGDKYGYAFEWDEEYHADFDVFEEQFNKMNMRYEIVKPGEEEEYVDFYCSKFKDTLTPDMEVLRGLEKIRFSTSPAEYFLWRGVEQWMTKTGMFDENMKNLKEDESWKEHLFFLSIHEAYKSWDILLATKVMDPLDYSEDSQSRHTTSVTFFKDLIMANFSYQERDVIGCLSMSKIIKVIKSVYLNAMEVAAWMAMEAAINIGYRFHDCFHCKSQEEFEVLVEKMAEAVITLLQDNDHFEVLYKQRLANVKKHKFGKPSTFPQRPNSGASKAGNPFQKRRRMDSEDAK